MITHSDGLARAMDDNADLEDLRAFQTRDAEAPSIDGLLSIIARELVAWRLDRLCQNDRGRWFAMLVHRDRVEYLLPVRVSVECATPHEALASVIATARAH